MYVFPIVVVVMAAVAFYLSLTLYALLRSQANRSIKLAVAEFHGAADSMMRTPQDLPNEVLTAIADMNYLAFARSADHILYNAIRQDRLSRKPREPGILTQKVKEMRPELQQLFSTATASWLAIMSNRHVLVGAAIRFELEALQVKSGSVTRHGVGEAEAIKVLPGMKAVPRVAACAA